MRKSPISSVFPRMSFAFAALALGFAGLGTVHGQDLVGTSFMYQGVLTDDGSPANGSFDLTFTLYDAPAGGSIVGDPVEVPGVPVSDGLFMVVLNFGSGPEIWDSFARWLEIEVEETVLSPRQAVRPSPYALALPGLRTLQSALSPSILGGYRNNEIGGGALGAVVAGGGIAEYTIVHAALSEDIEVEDGRNRALADFATVSGGLANVAGDIGATVGGGAGNAAQGLGSTVGGGGFNVAAGGATVAGGAFNEATGEDATIAGGVDNIAAGEASAVLGGTANEASGDHAAVGGGEDNHAVGLHAVVAGGQTNTANGHWSVIAGGSGNTTTLFAPRATVSGGMNNTASGDRSTVGGGSSNSASGAHGTIAGGMSNVASNGFAAVGGGQSNLASGANAVISGGLQNTAGGLAGTVPGGRSNRADGDMSFAAGRNARALHIGAFVWADSQTSNFDSTGANQFLIRASGRVGINTNNPLDTLDVNGTLRVTGLRTAVGTNSPSVIGGFSGNFIGESTQGAVIGGGGLTGFANSVTGSYGTIAGGRSNSVGGQRGAIGGGSNNIVDGAHGMIPGGESNRVLGTYGFAAGRHARADHVGSFVWADSSDPLIGSSTTDEFTVRAKGGVRMFTNEPSTIGARLEPGASAWSAISDRNMKRDITPVDAREVLERLTQIPISTWRYIHNEAGPKHMGPMAQDFHAAFGLGHDDLHLTTIDLDGVALAAIQGLHEMVREKDEEIVDLHRRIEQLEAIVNRLAESAAQ